MRRSHVVALGESPAIIAKKYTGDAARYPELVAANAQKPRYGSTFRSLTAGEVLSVPRAWQRAGLGVAPVNYRIPTSDEVVNSVVTSGVDWMMGQIHSTGAWQTIEEAAVIVASVPADALEGYITGVSIATTATATTAAVIAPIVTAILGEAAGAAVVGTVAAVAAVIPVVGEIVAVVVGVAAALYAIFGSGGCSVSENGQSVDCGDYVNKVSAAAQWLQDPENATKAIAMSVSDFTAMFGIFDVDVPSPGVPPPFGYNPDGSVIVMPGGRTLLRNTQIAAATAICIAQPNLLPIWRLTMPASFPLLTTSPTPIPFTNITIPSDVDLIVGAIQPIHDAVVENAAKWLASQATDPGDAAIASKFQLVPADIASVRQRATVIRSIGSHKQLPPMGKSSPSTTAEKVAGTTLAVGALGAAVTWGVAAYKGVSLATVVHDWYSRVRKAF